MPHLKMAVEPLVRGVGNGQWMPSGVVIAWIGSAMLAELSKIITGVDQRTSLEVVFSPPFAPRFKPSGPTAESV